jgi:3-isopropylmalate dehydrogenase
MKKKLVALIPGDGIGPEVIAQGPPRARALPRRARLPLDLWELDLGADRYLRDGTTFPAEIAGAIQRECSAVLLGALGDPRVPNLEHARDILFGMRFGLDLYANIRPVKALADRLVPLKGRGAKDVDFVVFRENTEGIYVGMGGQFKRGTPDEVAINEDVNTRKGVERIIRAAFEYAKKHGKQAPCTWPTSRTPCATPTSSGCGVFNEVAREYPGIEAARLRRRALPLPHPGSVPVRGHRHQQPLRRHRHRPRRRAPGRPRHGRERQRARRRARRASPCSSPCTAPPRLSPARTSRTRSRACSPWA